MNENLISEQDNKNLAVSVNPNLCVCFLYIFLVFNILLSGSFAILKCLFERGTWLRNGLDKNDSTERQWTCWN